MATYYQISLDEIEQLLVDQLGFQKLPAEATTGCEAVYGLRLKTSVPITCRVYTSITEGETEAREVGSDAIRVVLVSKDLDGKIVPLAKAKRVHRVEGWRQNLINRIEQIQTTIKRCPRCGGVLRERTNRFKKTKFYGCLKYPECRYTEDVK